MWNCVRGRERKIRYGVIWTLQTIAHVTALESEQNGERIIQSSSLAVLFVSKSTLLTMNYDLWDYDNNSAQIHFTSNPD